MRAEWQERAESPAREGWRAATRGRYTDSGRVRHRWEGRTEGKTVVRSTVDHQNKVTKSSSSSIFLLDGNGNGKVLG